MSDFHDPDYDRRLLAYTALTQARDALEHFDDPEVAQAAFGAHAPALLQAGWAPELVDAVHQQIGRQDAGPFIETALGSLQSSAPRVDPRDIKPPMTAGPGFRSDDDRVVDAQTALRMRTSKPAHYLGRDYTILYADDFDRARGSGRTVAVTPEMIEAANRYRDMVAVPRDGDEKVAYGVRDAQGNLVVKYPPGGVKTDTSASNQTAEAKIPLDAAFGMHGHANASAKGFVDDPLEPRTYGYGDTGSLASARDPRPNFTVYRDQLGWYDEDDGRLRFTFPTGSMGDSWIEDQRRNLNREQPLFYGKPPGR